MTQQEPSSIVDLSNFLNSNRMEASSERIIGRMERALNIAECDEEHIDNHSFARIEAIMQTLKSLSVNVGSVFIKMLKAKEIILILCGSFFILYGVHYQSDISAPQQLSINGDYASLLRAGSQTQPSNNRKLFSEHDFTASLGQKTAQVDFTIKDSSIVMHGFVNHHYHFSTDPENPTVVKKEGHNIIELTHMKRGDEDAKSMKLHNVDMDDIDGLVEKLKNKADSKIDKKPETSAADASHEKTKGHDEARNMKENEFRAKLKDGSKTEYRFVIEETKSPIYITQIRHLKNEYYYFSEDKHNKTKVTGDKEKIQ